MRILASTLLAAGLSAVVTSLSLAADTAPASFNVLADVKRVDNQDATHDPTADGSIAVSTGHKTEYPGVSLHPAKHWDLSSWATLAITVKNTSKEALEISARVDSLVARDERDEPHSMTQRLRIPPGQTQTLRVTLDRNPPGKPPELFGMRGVPAYAANRDQKKGDPSRVTQILVFLTRPTADHTFVITGVEARTPYVGPTVPKQVFPLIDMFGQHKHADWPGKVHSLDELRAVRDAEAKDLAAKPALAEWNEYGGFAKGPQFKATGFFRTEKVNGKWWLVDPSGRLFWSHGITCVGHSADTPIDGREKWFEDLPARDDAAFKPFFGKRNAAIMGYYTGKPGVSFNFAGANLFRKFGPGWKDEAIRVAHTRLRSWGMNTLGNWSEREYCLARKTPYTVPIHFKHPPIEGSKGYWGKFPDPYDPAFRANLDEAMKKEVGKSAGDPWCLGYFVDNELAWSDALALSVLESPETQAAKKAFAKSLQEKYATIGKLNAAWGTTHASWEALLADRKAPDKKKAAADLAAFTRQICDTYFRECRDAVKRVAPNQLYFGCRFAWSTDIAQQAAAEYCDVVAYNLYRRSVANFKPAFSKDVPIMNTEWHLGALDRGPFHPGLIPVKDQAERGKLYAQMVREHLDHPQFVGCHWFQYRDQATTGRTLDGENYQIGFVDICDTPYAETISAARDVGYKLYGLRK